MNAIEVNNLTKQYPGFSLSDVSFQLPQGSILGLVGENGAGKTTTIKMIMNAIRRDGGTVRVLGVDNQDVAFNEVKNDIGIVLDEAYFPEVMTAKQVGAIMKRTYRNWDDDYYSRSLVKLSLPENKAFKDFSRGMKMKLAISVALSHHPKLLVLDEATSGLDPIIRDEILDIFNDFTRDETHSILLSSHIVSDLEKICDYIAFIHKGKLVLCEEKDRLLEKFTVVALSKEEFRMLPRQNVLGYKENEYGVEVLLPRSSMPKAAKSERTTLENIILFLVKGENEQ